MENEFHQLTRLKILQKQIFKYGTIANVCFIILPLFTGLSSQIFVNQTIKDVLLKFSFHIALLNIIIYPVCVFIFCIVFFIKLFKKNKTKKDWLNLFCIFTYIACLMLFAIGCLLLSDFFLNSDKIFLPFLLL